MSLRRYVLFIFLVVLSTTSLYAQRTADFRRLSLENGNAAQKSWLISDQSSLGIDENGMLTGTFPNTNAMLTIGAGTKGNALDIQSLVGGTGILFSQNIPSVGIDMFLGASGIGMMIDGGTPLGITIGLITAGSDGMTIDATNSGISIGNGTAPNNGMNIEAVSTGLAIGTATTPDIGQTTDANITGGTFDAGIIGVDIGQNNSPILGLGVQASGTGVNVNMPFNTGTGINVSGPNFAGTAISTSNSFTTGISVINQFGTGIDVSEVFGTGLNINTVFGIGANITGGTDNVLVVNGTADATGANVGADPVWDARVNGDLHVSGETKFGTSIYVDGSTIGNHSILANDVLTVGTTTASDLNLVTGAGGDINITPGAGGVVNISGVPYNFPVANAPGELRNDGSGNLSWTTTGHGSAEFNNPLGSTWVVPTGITTILVEVQGAGGGGGGGGADDAGAITGGGGGGGGGAGAYAKAVIAVTPGSTLNIWPGLGGIGGPGGVFGGAEDGVGGGPGGASSIDDGGPALIVANGGTGGGGGLEASDPVGSRPGAAGIGGTTTSTIRKTGSNGAAGQSGAVNFSAGGAGGQNFLDNGSGGAGGAGSTSAGSGTAGTGGASGYVLITW